MVDINAVLHATLQSAVHVVLFCLKSLCKYHVYNVNRMPSMPAYLPNKHSNELVLTPEMSWSILAPQQTSTF